MELEQRQTTRITTGCAVVWVGLLGMLFGACDDGGSSRRPGQDSGVAAACEACLASGGTWQPEAKQCTENCDLQDISCFTDRCPGLCSAEACSSTCFSTAECEAVGCEPGLQDEFFVCRHPRPDPDGGLISDAGETRDAAAAPDAGPAPDSGLAPDAATDASTGSDASTGPHASTSRDAGADAAASADAAADASVDSDADVRESDCEACLASGGTWQPEAKQCTENCDLQDISCFTEQCPAPCTEQACSSTCFSEADCENVGCVWRQQDEAFSCGPS